MRLIGLSDRNKGQTPVFWVRGNSVSVNPADSCWTGELWRRQMVALGFKNWIYFHLEVPCNIQ